MGYDRYEDPYSDHDFDEDPRFLQGGNRGFDDDGGFDERRGFGNDPGYGGGLDDDGGFDEYRGFGNDPGYGGGFEDDSGFGRERQRVGRKHASAGRPRVQGV